MVRGRRNQLHSGSRVADLGDVVGDLAPGQLPALARLGSLRDLDLELLGACEIFGGHPEAPRGDLLDLGLEHVAFAQFDIARDAVRSEARAQRLARLHRRVALAVLAALAGVRSEEHTSELQSHSDLVCRLLLEKKKKKTTHRNKAP